MWLGEGRWATTTSSSSVASTSRSVVAACLRASNVTKAPSGASQSSASARTARSGVEAVGAAVDGEGRFVGAEVPVDLGQPRRRDVGEVRDGEVDAALQLRGQAVPPRAVVHLEAAGTARTLQRSLVDVHAVHLGLGQQHRQRGREGAGAAAEVDDDAGVGLEGDGGGEDGFGAAAGHEDAGGEGDADGAELGPADDLLERTSGRAVGDGGGPRRRRRRTSPRSRQPRPRRGRSRRRAGRARPRRGSPPMRQPGRIANMYDVQALRAHFPSLAGGTAYFDGPGGTQTPDVVGEAMRHTITQPLSNRGRLTRPSATPTTSCSRRGRRWPTCSAACRRGWCSGAA